MKLKNRYVLRYLCFRGLPLMLCFLTLFTAPLLVFSSIAENIWESWTLILLAICPLCCLTGCFTYHILRFSRMISMQESLYRIAFSAQHAVSVIRFSHWIILSDHWLIQPGKIALCRKHIKKISMSNLSAGKGGVRCMIRIKDRNDKVYSFRFRNEEIARKVRNWAK